MLLVTGLFFALGFLTIWGLGYHYFLLFVGQSQRQKQSSSNSDVNRLTTRYALIIPAHNEEAVIEETVRQLYQMVYPVHLYDVHVVADHCDDQTAKFARKAGATVHERRDGHKGRKGYVIEYITRCLMQDRARYDAFVIFDADSLVDPQFLAEVSQYFRLQPDAQVIQGQRIIKNPEKSLFNALDDADLRLNNRLRNQAKANLGLSARLMGDSMVFHCSTLEQHPWHETESLTEDRAFGLYLVLQRVRIHFLPSARSYIQAVSRWKDATPQRLRWYGGAFDLQKRYLCPLWREGIKSRNADALDKGVELVTLPFSMIALSSMGLLIVSVLLWLFADWSISPVYMSIGLTAFTILFPFLGLVFTGAHSLAYRAMLLGPLYVIWRLWINVTVRLKPNSISWVRTKRTEELEQRDAD